MDHEPYVGFVDAHAEGDGRHHDGGVGFQEFLQPLGAQVLVEAGVVGQRRNALAAQGVGQLVDPVARAGVDHA